MLRIRTLLIAFLLATLLPLATVGSTAPAPVLAEPAPEGPTYANGWTHRPTMELFTSLSCPPCMSSAEPASTQIWRENRDDPAVPFTFIVLHQTNGGNHDDVLAIQEAKDRYEFYSTPGTPDADFDGGYIQTIYSDNSYEDYVEDYEHSGDRDVKPTELRVWQEFKGDKFTFHVNLTYLGDPDFIPVVGGQLQDELNPTVYLFVVEDDILVYSSDMEKDVIAHNAYRGTALEDARPGTMNPGDEWTTVVDWEIPEKVVYPDGHQDYEGNDDAGEHDIPVPVNPANVEVVAIVFDLDDTSSQDSKGGNQKSVPRAINSATPRSTAYDEQNEPPKVTEYEETLNNDEAGLTVTFDDEDGMASAYVLFNYNNATHAGEWDFLYMHIEGESVCDDDGVCYAYDDATGHATIPLNEGKPIWYRIIMVDGNHTHNTTEARLFSGTGVSIEDDDDFPTMLVGGAIAAVGLGGLFVVWARRPVEGADMVDADMVFDEGPQPPAGE